MLTPEIQAEILAMYFGQKRGSRAIASKLQVSRKAVRKVIERRKVMLTVETSVRGSILDPFKLAIAGLLEKEARMPTRAILQQIRASGYLGGYTVVREFVRKTRAVPSRSREAFLQLEFIPGQCAQIDWGEFGDVFGDGVKVHCFLMVMCYSRMLYIEFTLSEKFEQFIRCHENAFKFFGSLVPQECWYDNLTSAVTERIGSLIRFNARFMAYMGHHGIRPHACNVARGNEKGRVEGGVKYIRSSFWPGREFKDFDDLCRQASQWRDEIANRREHKAMRKIPQLVFAEEEKKHLRAANPYRYDTDEIFSRVVPPMFHVVYDTNLYSVPWTLVGLSITIRINSDELKIFYHERFVTQHERSFKKHQKISRPEHSEGLLARKPGASRDGWQIAAVKNIGPEMAEYIDLLKTGSRSMRNEITRILALATVYGEAEVRGAVIELLKRGIVGVESLELALKTSFHPVEHELMPSPLNFPKAKLNRVVPTVDLRRYDALLFESAKTKYASNEVNTNGPNNNDGAEIAGCDSGTAAAHDDGES